MARPNDTLYANQWNFPAIDMERAWDIQPGASSDIIVAVLDSGMAFRTATLRYNSTLRVSSDAGRAALSGAGPGAMCRLPRRRSSARAARRGSWRRAISSGTTTCRSISTGTARTSPARSDSCTNNSSGTAGMAYNVRLMPVKVIRGVWDEIFGSPFEGTDDVGRARRPLRRRQRREGHQPEHRPRRGRPRTVVTDAIRYAVGTRRLRRRGRRQHARRRQRSRIGSRNRRPNIDGMVAVGAVGRTLDLAFYSTTGSYRGALRARRRSAAGRRQRRASCSRRSIPTCSKPTTPVASGPPRADSFAYEYFQGTSMATPHVSGFAALLMQQGITNPAAIEAAMKQFSTDKAPPGRDDSTASA